ALEHADGGEPATELVVVGDRARLDLPSLDLIAGTLLGDRTTISPAPAPPNRPPVPPDQWTRRLRAARHGVLGGWLAAGAGASAAMPAEDPAPLAVHRFTLRATPAPEPAGDLAAVLALVLCRPAGAPATLVGSIRGQAARPAGAVGAFEVPVVTPVEVGEDVTVAAYRAGVAALWRRSAQLWHTTRLERAVGDGALAVPAGLVWHRPLAGGEHYLPAQRLPYPLTLAVHPDERGGLRCSCWYCPDTVAAESVPRLAAHLQLAWDELTGGDQQRALAALPTMGRAETTATIALGRTPPAPGEPPVPLPEAFARIARATPDAPAVTSGDATMTYRELDARANRLAHALREHGVSRGDLVAVCMDRSADLIAVLIAILRAGAAYVPLDPSHPAARQSYMARDAAVRLVVADEATAAAFAGRPAVIASALAERARHCPDTPPAVAVAPDDPAYVIFTSGSTGRPKGVIVPHLNVLSLLAGTRDDFGFGRHDVWSWFHSVAFDFSVWEIWGALLTGGRLVVVPHWTTRSPEDFRELLVAERVTVLNQTPSAFAQLLELERREPADLAVRLVVFGGEPLDTRMLLPWFDVHPESGCRLVNMFGITETTVHVTAQTLHRSDALARSRSVGRPIPGWSVRVLDARGRPQPVGAAGEIAVGGQGVAIGYLNRPELTARRFVPGPDGQRLYLSGDRGRLLPDGRLEHLGRLDNQVKIRGYRIELDEIRGVLLEDPDVLAAAVVLRGDGDRQAGARLDAYVVLDRSEQAEEAARVRRRAARVLPDYMVPATVTAVPALPLTANGKLDAERLPPPALPGRGGGDGAERGEAEGAGGDAGGREPAVLCGVRAAWREALGCPVAADDNFFDLGGNSLLAFRAAANLRDQGFGRLPVPALYSNPTPRLLAAYLARCAADTDTKTGVAS
ncbi:MAG TPA: amino acid adenylation domain-containing protein, partial [Pseudonocardiaceae bacterium]|nr:amino acid adenylation domain-containing protein [Pseudonocardiaceae bacterium]